MATMAAAAIMAAATLYNGFQQQRSAKAQLKQQQQFQAQNLKQAQEQATEQEMQYNAQNQQSPNIEDFDTGNSASSYSNILSNGTDNNFVLNIQKLGANAVKTGYERYNQDGSI